MPSFIDELLPEINDGGNIRLYSGLTPLYRNGGEARKIFGYGKPDRLELMRALRDFVGPETWNPAVEAEAARRRIDPEDLRILSEVASFDFRVDREGVQYRVHIMGTNFRLRAFVSLYVEPDPEPEATTAYLLTDAERDAVNRLIRRFLIEPVETVILPDDDDQLPFLRGLTISQRRLLLRAEPEGDKLLLSALKALDGDL